MNTFLLEIGCEEIPAHFMPDILDQMEQKGKAIFEQYRLPYKDMRAYGTPRRIVLIVNDVARYQQDVKQLVKGPARKAAYGDDGQPTKALLGFMRSQNVSAEDLIIDEVNGIPYVYAHKVQRGMQASDALKEIAPQLVSALSFPKSMRWGDMDIRFVRPIRWIVALLDNEVISFDIGGISSGRYSRGHRFLGQPEVAIDRADSYIAVMERQFVIVDQHRRKDMISRQIKELADKTGGTALQDPDLLEEVVYLVEYPTAFLGSFDKKYLDLPEEVVITPMKDHQRYFPVKDDADALMPYFIGVRNGTGDYIDVVREGNEKVLRARLEDAKFFFEEDIKRPLEQRVEELKGIVFHDGLGTLYDKTVRLRNLCRYIGQRSGLNEDMLSYLDRAAYLSRADLVTDMVNEFDELQGIMGREYSILQGEPEPVAQAIYEMYLPRTAVDALPDTTVGIIMSLADKLDTLCGYFSIGLQPTGSQDPYGLRRQALGICRMIYDKRISISLRDAVMRSLELYDLNDEDRRMVFNGVLDFVKQRVRSMLIDEGLSYDVVDAAIAAGFDDICEVRERAGIIARWKTRPDFEDFMTAFNRPNNLAAKTDSLFVDENLFSDSSESRLWQAYKGAREMLNEALVAGDYDHAYEILKGLKPAVDEFFDAVLVMVDDPAIRANRLAILKNIAELFKTIGDFSYIVI
ncbi:MAG: glycyl-tRNA synthetase beta chain [Clostridiales bacterium]|nr:glycyl-tRNA synthetase beta chain [Clostridiales bacterium]